MGECIEREAVLRAVQGQRSPCRSPAQNRMLDCLKAAVIRISAADVAPLVHARWDDSGRYTFPSGSTAVRCTECGCALTESEYHLNNWNYCPVCGAKMDGERKDNENE